MTQLRTSDEEIQKVWNWCYAEFVAAGFKIDFPKNTDKRKTYQWRYAAKLVEKLDEWEFDEATSKVFIKSVVQYSKKNKLIHKGMSAFFQNNMLQICYNNLKDMKKDNNAELASVISSKKFLDAKLDNKPAEIVLLEKGRIFTNVVEWYENGKLSILFLALSKSCTKALFKLKETDLTQRRLIPSTAELLLIRDSLSDNSDLVKQLSMILGNDWRKQCLH